MLEWFCFEGRVGMVWHGEVLVFFIFSFMILVGMSDGIELVILLGSSDC